MANDKRISELSPLTTAPENALLELAYNNSNYSITRADLLKTTNTLISTSTINPLSAAMGKYLNENKTSNQQQIIRVAKSGGDFVEPQDAIDSITDASITKQYLIKIAPGRYLNPIVLKSWVNIEDSGAPYNVVLYDVSVNFTNAAVEETYIYNCYLGDLAVNFTNPAFDKNFVLANSYVQFSLNVSGEDKIKHLLELRNNVFLTSLPTDMVFSGILVDSTYNGYYGGYKLDNAVLQHTAGEMVGDFYAENGSEAFIRGNGVSAYPLLATNKFYVNDTALLNIDSNSYATIQIIRGVGVTDAQIQVLTSTSAGVISPKPVFTDNGDGTVDLSTCQVFIYDNDHQFGNPRRFQIAQVLSQVLVDNNENFVMVDYNNGTPIYLVSTTNSSNDSDRILVGKIFRKGTELHIFYFDAWGEGLPNKLNQYLIDMYGYRRSTGLALGYAPTKYITITAGRIYYGCAFTDVLACNSQTDYVEFWAHVAGVYTEQSPAPTTYNSTQYDNGTALQTLLPNRVVANYIFRGVENDAHIYFVLGNSYGTLLLAQAEGVPSNLPTIFTQHCIYVGRAFFATGGTVPLLVESAFTTSVVSGGVDVHNDLSGIQGGTAAEYYHLTAAQHAIATQAATGSVDGYLTAANYLAFSGKENALTFSTGLTRAVNTITANLSAGVAGGQSAYGGTAASEILKLYSTLNATKGKIYFGDNSAYDEVNKRFGAGTLSPSAEFHAVGGSGGFRGQLGLNTHASGLVVYDESGNFMGGFEGFGSAYPTTSLRNHFSFTSALNNVGDLIFRTKTGGSYFERMRIKNAGQVGLNGISSATAWLHLPAGLATANFAPLKFTSGVNLTVPEAGAIEYDGSFWATIGTAARYKIPLIAGTDYTPNPLINNLDGGEYDLTKLGDLSHNDATASDWVFRNYGLNKAIRFFGNYGGVNTELFTLDYLLNRAAIGATNIFGRFQVNSAGYGTNPFGMYDADGVSPLIRLQQGSAGNANFLFYAINGNLGTILGGGQNVVSNFQAGVDIGVTRRTSAPSVMAALRTLNVVGLGIDNVATNGATFGAEVLTNGALTSGTSWTAGGDATLTADTAVFAYATGTTAYINQASTSFATAMKTNTWYAFTFTVSGATRGTNGDGFAEVQVNHGQNLNFITMFDGTRTFYFKTDTTTPNKFRLTVALTAGQGFTIDDLSLKEITSGGLYTGGGANGLYIAQNGDGIQQGDFTSNKFKLAALNTAPANATDTGTLGEIRWASGYVYLCVATNTWQRAALATW